MSFRRIVFWAHFAAGIAAGSIVFLMSSTGALLAFEHEIVDWAEAVPRSGADVDPSAWRSLDELAAAARATSGKGRLATVTIRRESPAVLFGFGAGANAIVDAASGASLGGGATRLRGFFASVTDLHRWLGMSLPHRALGRSITGACNAAFFFLALSGPLLWWPKRWTAASLRAVTVPSATLRGWRRDWNWHNAIGFWSAPVLVVITLSGIVMSYPAANDLLFRLAGSEPPPRRSEAARAVDPSAEDDAPPKLDPGFQAAAERAPAWRRMSLRLPRPGENRGTVLVEDGASSNPYARSTLTFDAASGAVLEWEPYEAASRGRRLRTWVRGLHTGEAVGVAGQTAAALASLGGTVLAWTGIALGLRRIFRVRRSPPEAS